jgi:allantoinase
LGPAEVEIRDGKIAAIRTGGFSSTPTVLDAGDCYVMPGIVDTHVHINEPGRTEWEGFESATRSAAAGGVTTLVDMPLNSIPPTTTVEALHAKRAAAPHAAMSMSGFWGGVVPGHSKHIESLARAGCWDSKCFLSPSGVDEFANVTERDLREAMPILSRVSLPLLVHAELPSELREPAGDPRRYQTWLDSRPPGAEAAAIDLLIELAREFRTHVHIEHLAAPTALGTIRRARQAGVTLTVETCPHYLTFAAEDVPDGATGSQVRAANPECQGTRGPCGRAWCMARSISSPQTTHLPHLR